MQTETILSKPPGALRKPCDHCGVPTAASDTSDKVFCCSGCMGAYALIHEMGLDDFYALRKGVDARRGLYDASQIGLLENPQDAGIEIKELAGGYQCVRLAVDGIHCAACSWLIERMQPNIQGLYSARVRMSDNSVELVFNPSETNLSRIAKRLSPLGYELGPWTEDVDFESEVTKRQRRQWSNIAIAAFFAANSMWIGISLYAGEATGISKDNEYFLRWVGAILGLLAVLFPGRVFFQTAWQSILQKSPHVDIPVAISLTIGTIGSIYGAATSQGHIYFDSLASLILLLLVGRYIQFRAQVHARKSIGRLLRWNTPVAKVVKDEGKLISTKSDRLQIGELVFVEAGGIFPADGTLESDATDIDTSLISGESRPVAVRKGDSIIGGTTNLSHPAYLQVTASGANTRIGKILDLVKEATTYKTPWIQLADHVGKWFVIVVLFVASATWCAWAFVENMAVATQNTMALLTIACPCALALAAPLVITIALGRAAKKKIWIREGTSLEQLSKPGFIWFDKTGTLTTGELKVQNWFGDAKWLQFAAQAETNVQHPVASAIIDYAARNQATPTSKNSLLTDSNSTRQVTGRGTSSKIDGHWVHVGNILWMHDCQVELDDDILDHANEFIEQGNSAVYVAVENHLVGVFGIGDELRPEAIPTLKRLQKLGWEFGLLSGDHQPIVQRIAEQIAKSGVVISPVLGDRSPEEKRAVVQASMQKFGRQSTAKKVVMVGDGVNDAAALAESDVGISIRGNSEQSLAVAPIYIANSNIGAVSELVEASREVVKVIRRCFAISLLYNVITISLAALGLIHPLIAALFMPLSGVSVLAMALHSRAFIQNKPSLEFPPLNTKA